MLIFPANHVSAIASPVSSPLNAAVVLRAAAQLASANPPRSPRSNNKTMGKSPDGAGTGENAPHRKQNAFTRAERLSVARPLARCNVRRRRFFSHSRGGRLGQRARRGDGRSVATRGDWPNQGYVAKLLGEPGVRLDRQNRQPFGKFRQSSTS